MYYFTQLFSWCCYIIDWYELKTILNVFCCVEWIIKCLSNNQNYRPPPRFFEVLTLMFVPYIHRRILGQKHWRITLRKASSNTQKTCPKEGRVNRQMSKNSVNLEEWILLTVVGFQAITMTETKSWESNRIFMSPKQTPEGNANITVLFYEITERVESKF